MQKVKALTGITELLYLSTCNRIEFVFTRNGATDNRFLEGFFNCFRDDWQEEEISFAVSHARVYTNDAAVRHLMEVASSLDSMVVGEREIITQVRNAYERCKKAGLTGDALRLVIKNVVTTAKQVYTGTRVGENPLSVVSLAFRKLRNLPLAKDARFIIVGAGETNGNLLKYLDKYGFQNFSIFNRTKSNAQKLAENFSTGRNNVQAFPLDQLSNFKNGFDVLITCTAATGPVVTETLYRKLLQSDEGDKIIVDLALPADVDKAVVSRFSVHYIGLEDLKKEAAQNLQERESEMQAAQKIIDEGIKTFHAQSRTRKVELKMREIPEQVRAIKSKAMNDVFANEINSLDEKSKSVLENILDYMEKKYISGPMVLAKEIMLKTMK